MPSLTKRIHVKNVLLSKRAIELGFVFRAINFMSGVHVIAMVYAIYRMKTLLTSDECIQY